MANIQDLQNIFGRIQIAINDERIEIQEIITNLRSEIEVLKVKTITQDQLDLIGLELDNIIVRIKEISESDIHAFIWDQSTWDDNTKKWGDVI
jgi:hypothetical protein